MTSVGGTPTLLEAAVRTLSRHFVPGSYEGSLRDPNQGRSFPMKIMMRCLLVLMMICPLGRAGEPPAVKQVDLKSLKLDLPTPLRLKAEMARLTRPELEKEYGAGPGSDRAGNPEGWVRIYRADDGLLFLADDIGMSLWFHEQDGWHPLLQGVKVEKPFGGLAPWLPVQYLGKGFFAVSQTAPGTVKQKEDDRIPQALAVTFLLDSWQGKIVARSENFIYSHNPPVKIPENWATIISAKNITPSRGDSPHSTAAPKPEE